MLWPTRVDSKQGYVDYDKDGERFRQVKNAGYSHNMKQSLRKTRRCNEMGGN